MFFCQKLLFFIMLLLGITATVSAQTTKQVEALPTPHTEEVKERAFVAPATERTTEISSEKLMPKQQKMQQELEQQKAQEAALVKERELESKKVINPNWRNQKSVEQQILEAKRAEVEAINQQEKQQREAEIKATELQLQQTTDEGMKQKLLNKINNLRNNPTETGLAE